MIDKIRSFFTITYILVQFFPEVLLDKFRGNCTWFKHKKFVRLHVTAFFHFLFSGYGFLPAEPLFGLWENLLCSHALREPIHKDYTRVHATQIPNTSVKTRLSGNWITSTIFEKPFIENKLIYGYEKKTSDASFTTAKSNLFLLVRKTYTHRWLKIILCTDTGTSKMFILREITIFGAFLKSAWHWCYSFRREIRG